MGIILFFVAVLGIGFCMLNNRKLDVLGFLLTCMGVVCLSIALILLPISRMESEAQIHKFESTRATFMASRYSGEKLENAAIQVKIAEANEWQAGAVYWNNSVFDIWISDDVEYLKPIR